SYVASHGCSCPSPALSPLLLSLLSSSTRRPPSSPLFPYTTLFRSGRGEARVEPQPPGRGNLGGGRAGHEQRQACGEEQRGRSHRSEEHTSELQSLTNLVCRLLLEKKKKRKLRNSPLTLTATRLTPS